jgi:hypothetical protein
MPVLFDLLYREYCRARLAEMRKQLLLWPGPGGLIDADCDCGQPEDAADLASGPGGARDDCSLSA